MTADPTRRRFLRSAVLAPTVGTVFHRLSQATASDTKQTDPNLRPAEDLATGLPLLNLPPGFTYRSFGWTGDAMSDGTTTPGEHDGMAVIGQEGDRLTLCRNHEIRGQRSFGCDAITYDTSAGGGCTNLVFNTATGDFEKCWASLAGTVKNCAGGPTPWGSWLSCEETVVGPGEVYKSKPVPHQQDHGWIFEVPRSVGSNAVPLKDMGRFVHEAIAIDPRDNMVYETEDRDTSGFYRFTPATPGKLSDGGRLQMLKAAGREDLTRDCRGKGPFDVTWIDIDDPLRPHSPGTQDTLGVYSQGKAQGATTFNRVEGCWFGDGVVYFTSTDGGDASLGQIWAFSPKEQTLRLVFESPSKQVLANPDNVTVSPRGGLVVCEDTDHLAPRLHALSSGGQLAPVAENNVVLPEGQRSIAGDYRDGEWAGVCFSPDGRWLFANIQTPGITFAITGPWEQFGV